MAGDGLRLLMESLGMQVLEHQRDPRASVAILISETLRFRDKLKEETGAVLTVADTRRALEALEYHLKGRPLPDDLTEEQRTLARIYIDRLTLFS